MRKYRLGVNFFQPIFQRNPCRYGAIVMSPERCICLSSLSPRASIPRLKVNLHINIIFLHDEFALKAVIVVKPLVVPEQAIYWAEAARVGRWRHLSSELMMSLRCCGLGRRCENIMVHSCRLYCEVPSGLAGPTVSTVYSVVSDRISRPAPMLYLFH